MIEVDTKMLIKLFSEDQMWSYLTCTQMLIMLFSEDQIWSYLTCKCIVGEEKTEQ